VDDLKKDDEMTEKIVALDREAKRIIGAAEREAASYLAEAEERDNRLSQQTRIRLEKEKAVYFSMLREKLEEFEKEQREKLEKRIKKLSEIFEAEETVDGIFRQIETRLCGNHRR